MNKTIVIMYSGMGGLSYLDTLRKRAKGYHLIYLADTEAFPYGLKTHEQLLDRFKQLLPKIREFKPSLLLIACNTASLHGTTFFKTQLKIPIIPTRPSLKTAYSQSHNKKIAVLATAASISSAAFQELLDPYPNGSFFPTAATSLVSFVENDLIGSTEQQQHTAVKPYFEQLIKQECDTAVLGCTHFIHLKKAMQQHFPQIKLIDNTDEVTGEAMTHLKEDFEGEMACHLYQTSAHHQVQYQKMAERFKLTYKGVI
jgi:glutamate racemase